MKRFTIGLCGLLVLGLVTAVHAEEPTPEKKAASEKAYKELSEFLMADGGVWKATVPEREQVDGKWTPTGKMDEMVNSYRLIAEGTFLQRTDTKNGEPVDQLMIIGVDSETKELSVWVFAKIGVDPAPITKQKDGIWIIADTSTDEQGQLVKWKMTLTLGKDKIRLETAATVDGNELPKEVIGPPINWKRHKK